MAGKSGKSRPKRRAAEASVLKLGLSPDEQSLQAAKNDVKSIAHALSAQRETVETQLRKLDRLESQYSEFVNHLRTVEKVLDEPEMTLPLTTLEERLV